MISGDEYDDHDVHGTWYGTQQQSNHHNNNIDIVVRNE